MVGSGAHREPCELYKNGIQCDTAIDFRGKIAAGHDVASGGLITTLLEMCFANECLGAEIDLYGLKWKDSVKILLPKTVELSFRQKWFGSEPIPFGKNIAFHNLGKVSSEERLAIKTERIFYVLHSWN